MPEGEKGYDIGWAIDRLRAGALVRRRRWSLRSVFLYLVPGSRFGVNRAPLLGIFVAGTEIDYADHIDVHGEDGRCGPWVPSTGDLLATDWEETTSAKSG